MKIPPYFFLCFFFFPLWLFPQAAIDTLHAQLPKCADDSCKRRIENLIVEELISSDEIAAKKLSEKLFYETKPDDTKNYLSAHYNFALLNIYEGSLNKAFKILSDLKIRGMNTGNESYQAKASLGLSKFYTKNNDLKTAVDLSFAALKYFEKVKDSKNICLCYLQIASINYKLRNEVKALQMYEKALEVSRKISYYEASAIAYNGLGSIYSNRDQQELGLECYGRALKIRREQKHYLQIAALLTNIGTIYSDKSNLKEAEKYYKESLELNLQNHNTKSAAICYINLGNVFYNSGNYRDAEVNYANSLRLLDNTDLSIKENLFYNLGEVNFKLGNLEKALRYNDSCMTVKDSLYNRESIKTLNEMQTKYETEKTKLELEKRDLEANSKQMIIYVAFGGCFFLLILVFFIFRGLKNEKRTSHTLEEKNKIINEQKHLVEEKNKDIGDSIRYAQRIQQAILPPEVLWNETLKNSFILYSPKDILSGDFYWLEETHDHIFIAAADCTGHGVPGALVSIVNYNILNKAVLEKGITDPGKILDAANISLTQSLHQSFNESQIKDGMDVALISIHKTTGDIFFAGANNPIYILSNGTIKTIKADKFPVGAFIEDKIQSFTSHKLQINKGDKIYMFSDGFADQFGGLKGKKYKYKQLQEKLIASSHLTMEGQKEFMNNDFLKWKGSQEQVDDVLLIGLEI